MIKKLIEHLHPPMEAMLSMSAVVKLGSLVMGAILVYVAPVQSFLVAVYVLLLTDMGAGIWASRINKVPFTADKLGHTVSKFIVYTAAILLAQLMVNVFFADMPIVDGLTYTISLIICSTEFKSNLEKFSVITKNQMWSRIADWLDSKTKNKLP